MEFHSKKDCKDCGDRSSSATFVVVSKRPGTVRVLPIRTAAGGEQPPEGILSNDSAYSELLSLTVRRIVRIVEIEGQTLRL